MGGLKGVLFTSTHNQTIVGVVRTFFWRTVMSWMIDFPEDQSHICSVESGPIICLIGRSFIATPELTRHTCMLCSCGITDFYTQYWTFSPVPALFQRYDNICSCLKVLWMCSKIGCTVYGVGERRFNNCLQETIKWLALGYTKHCSLKLIFFCCCVSFLNN